MGTKSHFIVEELHLIIKNAKLKILVWIKSSHVRLFAPTLISECLKCALDSKYNDCVSTLPDGLRVGCIPGSFEFLVLTFIHQAVRKVYYLTRIVQKSHYEKKKHKTLNIQISKNLKHNHILFTCHVIMNTV